MLGDPSEAVVDRVREICRGLPETHEAPASPGTRWLIRRRSVAHVFTMDVDGQEVDAIMFRASGPELEALAKSGWPYLVYDGWRNAAVMFLDENTDWDEVLELVTESYRLMAPKKLASLLDSRGDGLRR